MTTFLLILLSSIGLLVLPIILLDLFYHYREIYSRIWIGRWDSESDWLQAISRKARQWAKNTPTVKLTDNNRYILLDKLKGKYRSGTIQSWQEAGLLLGLGYAAKNGVNTAENNHSIEQFISNKFDNNFNWKTPPEQVDAGILAYALMKYTRDETKLQPALQTVLEIIERCKDRNGLIAYRSFIPTIHFVDTIGFICPFLTRYGLTFDRPEYIDLAFRQIEEYTQNCFDPNRFLPVHAYDRKEKFPLGVFGWGRGLGWYILGITDMYTELPEADERRNYLSECIVKVAKETLLLQMENGGFKAMLVVENSRYDSSATAIIGWVLWHAYQITGESKYKDAAKKCINALMTATRRDGSIDFCQGDTKGIGMYADTFDIMPFVQGLAIRLTVALEIK